MSALGVSTSTFQRVCLEYESVFTPLERDSRKQRIWTIDAARRLQQAHEAVRIGKAESYRSAFDALRNGRELLSQIEQISVSPSDSSEVLEALRLQVMQQGDGITTLLKNLDARDVEIIGALRALADAQVEQSRVIQALHDKIQASARPVPTPGKLPRSLLVRLLRAVLGD